MHPIPAPKAMRSHVLMVGVCVRALQGTDGRTASTTSAPFLWVFSSADGEVVSRSGSIQLVKRFCEKVSMQARENGTKASIVRHMELEKGETSDWCACVKHNNSDHSLPSPSALLDVQTVYAFGFNKKGERTPLGPDVINKVAAWTASTTPPEFKDLVLLESIAKPFQRYVAAEATLEATPAGRHMVRCTVRE